MQFSNELVPVDLETIERMAEEARGQVDRIFLHWTAGRYGQIFEDYHVSIDYDGKIFLPNNCQDLNQYRIHTWRRNSRSIAVTLCCCYGAIANNGWDADFGDYPPTNVQIEVMSQVVAALCRGLDLPISNVFTHCEIAKVDGYGPFQDSDCRWDLWFLKDFDGIWKNGGDIIRGKAVWYAKN